VHVLLRFAADFHLDAPDALVDPPGQLFLQFVERIGSKAATAVYGHTCLHLSPKGNQRQIEQPRLQVPQRVIDSGDRHRTDPRPAQIADRGGHRIPARLDRQRIAADYQAGQPVVDQFGRCHIGVTEADAGSVIGPDLDQYQRRCLPGEDAVGFRRGGRNSKGRPLQAGDGRAVEVKEVCSGHCLTLKDLFHRGFDHIDRIRVAL
jgi:hypothetical protein